MKNLFNLILITLISLNFSSCYKDVAGDFLVTAIGIGLDNALSTDSPDKRDENCKSNPTNFDFKTEIGTTSNDALLHNDKGNLYILETPNYNKIKITKIDESTGEKLSTWTTDEDFVPEESNTNIAKEDIIIFKGKYNKYYAYNIQTNKFVWKNKFDLGSLIESKGKLYEIHDNWHETGIFYKIDEIDITSGKAKTIVNESTLFPQLDILRIDDFNAYSKPNGDLYFSMRIYRQLGEDVENDLIIYDYNNKSYVSIDHSIYSSEYVIIDEPRINENYIYTNLKGSLKCLNKYTGDLVWQQSTFNSNINNLTDNYIVMKVGETNKIYNNKTGDIEFTLTNRLFYHLYFETTWGLITRDYHELNSYNKTGELIGKHYSPAYCDNTGDVFKHIISDGNAVYILDENYVSKISSL